MNIYWKVLIITAILAVIFRHNKKHFVICAAIVHAFIGGFRYMHMHGDLMKYDAEFQDLKHYSLFSDRIGRQGKNTLFYALNKIVGDYTDYNFQILIIIIAVFSAIAVGILVYKYSEKPLISYLVWNCFGFYIFTFYSIKQALAMAIIMFAVGCIIEKKRMWFYILVIIAGFVHFPAFIFLPAYEISQFTRVRYIVYIYVAMFVIVFLYRNRIVTAMTDVYYEDENAFTATTGMLGGKAILMIVIFVIALLFCSMGDQVSRTSIILIGMASILQMFSVYDNVFTRLADYYFQFFVLLAPSMLAQKCRYKRYPVFYFTENSQRLLTVVFIGLALIYYNTTTLSAYTGGVDDLVHNFVFMWQVGD